MRVMVRMETATYAESVISTPIAESGGAERAHAERDDVHRPAAHRAAEDALPSPSHPWKISRISAGAFQWLVGPASSSFSEQMKVRSSTRATSRRVGGGVVRVRALDRVELRERALVDELLAQALVLGLGAVTPDDAVRLR